MRTVLVLAFAVFACACSGQSTGQSPTSPSATPPPTRTLATAPALSGSVYEVTPQGLRAVSNGNVWYSVDGGRIAMVNIDPSGRYAIPVFPPGSRITLTAFSVGLQQTCAVNTASEGGDAVPDIKLVRVATHDPTCEGPALSGVVFRIVDGEMRPLKGQPVGFSSGAHRGRGAVYGTTDAAGRFEFGGLPRGAGSLLAGDCSDAMDSKSVEIIGNANVVNFDLTPFVESCPWIFLPD